VSTTPPVASPIDFDTYGDYVVKSSATATATGAFTRPPYGFRDRVTADGTSGYPAEPGRYHLYVSYACPWAHRSIIVRSLKKLEDVVTMSAVDPVRDGRGWAFRDGDGHTPDPVNGFRLLREAYEATDPGYDGHVSVPVLWDRQTSGIVSNNFPDITLDLNTQFEEWADTSVDLYPSDLRPEIDALNDHIYKTVNNGVYRSGFATTQQAYTEAVTTLFATLDDLEKRLTTSPYLFGDRLTESDIRLWVTLVRFDTVYTTHFKTNLHRLTDYESLWSYTRRLYAIPAFHTTTNFTHIKNHYYTTHPQLNPSRIVPIGPTLTW
jgi:putative glutathione S-transferase